MNSEQSQQAVTDETFASLLAAVDSGETELIDSRVGKHTATLIGVEVTANNDGRPALVVILGGMVDTNEKEFDIKHRLNVALASDLNNEDDKRYVFAFLGALKSLGVVPISFKRPLFGETPDQVQALADAILVKVGTEYPGQIKVDDNGFPRWTFFRSKKKAEVNGSGL